MTDTPITTAAQMQEAAARVAKNQECKRRPFDDWDKGNNSAVIGICAAIRAIPVTEPDVQVKELEWDALDEDEYGLAAIADGMGITYEAGIDADGFASWCEHKTIEGRYVVVEGNEMDAMAAAQADFQSRVRERLK
jgi:hypothetical protein